MNNKENKMDVIDAQTETEVSNCKRCFIRNNKYNYVTTIITQSIFSIVSISISLLMKETMEAIQHTDAGKVKVAAIMLFSIVPLYAIFGLLQKKFRNRYLKTALTQYKQHIFERILNNGTQ